VNYRRYFFALVIALGLLIAVDPFEIHLMFWNDSHFAWIGFLHATASVVSLRAPRRYVERILFVVLVTALSVAVPYAGLLAASPFDGSHPGSGWRDAVPIALGSAMGAAGYAALVRALWMPKMMFGGLGLIVCLCVFASLAAVAVKAADALTVFWWVAFSVGLFFADRPRQRVVAVVAAS
jgi:hypothetical protein